MTPHAIAQLPSSPPRWPETGRVVLTSHVPHAPEDLVINRVEPQYPYIALCDGIQGDVVLAVQVGPEGTVKNVGLVSGHPYLASAAIEAVRQWRYRPFTAATQAVDVEVTVVLSFQLGPVPRLIG
jgi:TonB family protein